MLSPVTLYICFPPVFVAYVPYKKLERDANLPLDGQSTGAEHSSVLGRKKLRKLERRRDWHQFSGRPDRPQPFESQTTLCSTSFGRYLGGWGGGVWGGGGIPTAFSRLLLSVSLCVGSVTDTRRDGLLYCSVWLSVAAVLSATVSPR